VNLETLSQAWLHAKEAERVVVDSRRDLEDQLTAELAISDQLDGSETRKIGEYTIKVTGRINRTIDSEKLQELATESGLTDHLSSLFRWKPEINMSAWTKAEETITRPLAGAITAKPGRPSYAITKATKE
jgi:hypothetical protein